MKSFGALALVFYITSALASNSSIPQRLRAVSNSTSLAWEGFWMATYHEGKKTSTKLFAQLTLSLQKVRASLTQLLSAIRRMHFQAHISIQQSMAPAIRRRRLVKVCSLM